MRARARRLAIAKAKSQNKKWRLELPPLEDMHAVQTAIMNVVEGLAAGALDSKTGGLILYALQQAANNVRSVEPWLGDSRFAIKEYEEMRVESYPGLEAEFGLEKNLDFDAPPETLFPPPQLPEPEKLFPPKKPPVSIEGLKAWKEVLAEAERELKTKSS